MSLTQAILIPGLLLLALGSGLVFGGAGVSAALRAFPRSRPAAYVCFGLGGIWFLSFIANLSPADFGDYKTLLLVGFFALGILSFRYVPDFLAVRGLCILVLLGAWPLLMAGYMVWGHRAIYFQKVAVYIALSLAIWLGAQPWRLRDFLDWLFARPGRARSIGGFLAGYGLLLVAVAFTY